MGGESGPRGAANAGGANDERLRAAVKRALAAPSEEAAWNEAEALGAELQKPEDVVAAYVRALKGKPAPALAARLGQRALRFQEEWLGSDSEAVGDILERVLAADPTVEWAFERLTLVLSVAQRWEDLLGFYDRALEALEDGPRRRSMLLEAAGVAKDFLGHIDRAIGYLEQLFRVRPTDGQVASSLERLLERQEAWEALAKVWQVRLPLLAGADARELRERAATLYLDRLADHQRALTEARLLVESGGDDTVACGLLERILANPGASPDVRARALGLLRTQHEKHGREARMVEALRVALGFATGDEKIALLRELAERLYRAGDTAAAMEQIVGLLALSPEDAALRSRLAHLAGLAGAHDVHVRGLLAAAEAAQDGRLRVGLLLEAAQVEEEILARLPEAIALYRRVVDDDAAESGRKLAVLRRLADLLPGETVERLAVLERLAELEKGAGARRAALGEAARIAATLADRGRAVAAWEARLALDPSDREALDALVDLRAEDAPAVLVEALRRRAAAPLADEQRRADLARVAEVQARALGDLGGAVETWREVERRFGEDRASSAALRALLGEAGRWRDLVDRLGAGADADRTRLAELCQFLGDVCRQHLEDPPTAAAWYARALSADPAQAAAREGLRAMLGDERCRPTAVAALARSFEQTDDARGLLELVPHRLALALDDGTRAHLHLDAAELAERRAGDRAAALAHLAAALGHARDDGRIVAELLRLAEATGRWDAAADALKTAGEALAADGAVDRAATLRAHEAQVAEQHLRDAERALAAWEAALKHAPERTAHKAAVARLAAAAGRWPLAVDALLSAPVLADVCERELWPTLEHAAAGEEAAVRALGEALAAGIARRPSLPYTLARELEGRLATQLARAGDGEGAERALARAATHDPQHAHTLERLAAAQRARPGRPLYDTLMRLAALSPTALDPLLEAATVARETLNDEELARAALGQLLDRATQQARAGGAPAALDAALRAVDGLATVLVATGDRAEARRAALLLLDATGLPIAPGAARGLRRRAGRVALENAADPALAREIYRRLVDDEPEDREAVGVLSKLYEEAQLYPELLVLKRRELSVPMPDAERLALRLELARLGGVVEAQTARVQTLLANLDESPGHAATVDALADVLHERGRHGELAEVLSAQARRLEERGDGDVAAALWTRVAALAERPLGDLPRAIAAYERVAALQAAAPTLDALARLYLACGEPATAASWLEQRLTATPVGGERVDVAMRLADAYAAAAQRHRATTCLERALGEQPDADGARAKLVELYRAAEQWEPLARALAERAQHSQEKDVVLASAREVAALCRDRLNAPEKAAGVLSRALEVQPGDRELRGQLAESLRAGGRLPEARAVLQGLLDEVGRRRSRDRAALHHQIALVARAEGDLKLALEHLEQAAGMALDNPAVQLALAEVAEQSGELPRAEQAYRALLVLARRGDPGEAPLSASEVLLRLEGVARARGQKQAAAECLDSAMAAAMQSPAEARRLQGALVARGDGELARSLLEKRRAAASGAIEEARVCCEMADVLARTGREAEGLDLLLKALEKVPENAEAHALARDLARKQGQSQRYLDALLAGVDQRRRWDDAPRVAELLLRAGEVAEQDLGDLHRASGYYVRAEESGARVVDALTALARVGAARGDRVEETRALVRLRQIAAEQPTAAEQAEIYFRLAERQLASPTARVAGLEALSQALERAPDFARALALVRGAGIPEADLSRVLPLYERVARASGNDQMLLDYLERRAAAADVKQGEVREGVELALALGDGRRAEALLERAVALGRERPEGRREAAWALLELAERRRAGGDLDAAALLLDEAREASTSPRVLGALRDLARDAARRGLSALAARVLERLREAYPTDREVWQPLVELYAAVGDRPSLERLVVDTTAKLLDRAERNLVRMAWAKFLVGSDEPDQAGSVLRDVLLDEPGRHDAVTLLADLYEKRGEVNDAVALLSEALRDGESRPDDARRAALAGRLAELVRKADPAQAKQVYRSALAAPFTDAALKRSLQTALLDLLGGDENDEKAALLEDMLGGESGEAAAAHALELHDLRQRLGDERGARRALEIGRARAPRSRTLLDRLEALYEEGGRWRELSDLLLATAEQETVPAEAASALRRAARLRRDKLQDPATAADLLRRAAAQLPGAPDLLRELAACLVQMNRFDAAIEEVTRALERSGLAPESRVGLLRLRAELRGANGEDGPAVTDLEQAFGVAGLEVAGELTDALFRLAARCANEGQSEAERTTTFRLAEVFAMRGEGARAQDILFRWVENHPDDYEALRALRQRFEADGRWDEVAQICARLVEAETGVGKIEAAMGLAEACERLGHAAEAITTLEQLLQEMPSHRALIDRLVRLHQATGNLRRMGALMVELADAETDEQARFAALTGAAEVLLREGDPQGAFAALEKAVALRPRDRVARRLLADASLQAGLYQEASEVVGALLSESRGAEPAELGLLYHRLGRAAGGLGDRAGQLQALKRALEADRKNGLVAAELAELAESAGDDDLALRALRAVTLHAQNGPLSPAQAFFRQARIVLRQGDRPRAIIFTKRALQEDPALEEARSFLAQLG